MGVLRLFCLRELLGVSLKLYLKNKSIVVFQKFPIFGMATIGKVREDAAEFEWQIDEFFSLPEKDEVKRSSPSFSLAGESWCFDIYPNGRSQSNSVGYVGAYLCREVDGPPISVACSLGVKTFEGKTDQERQFTYTFEKVKASHGWPMFLKRSDLSEKKTELVPSDVLTLVWHIELYSKSKDAEGSTATAMCSHCKCTLDAEYVPTHEKKCPRKPMECPACGKVVVLKEWLDHACDIAIVKATKKLVDDLADILVSGEHSDVTIRVKDKEFRLHRSILAARNPFFSTMFKTEMKEKISGIVTVDDCEPEIYQSFINFIYTGKMHTLSCDNVCALYEVADKYQEDQLKAECLSYMKNEISLDSFVDFIVLALRQGEKELLQKAANLFCRNVKDIIHSVKWQTFVQEYPIQANELHIKAVNYYAK